MKYDVVGLGLNAVDHLAILDDFPKPGVKMPMLEFTRQGGGQVATALVCYARLGLRTSYLGKVGDDDLGAFSRASLESEGIDISGMVVVPGEVSQFAFILVPRSSGERTILWKRGPGLVFRDDDFPEERICQGRLLHLDTHEVPGSIRAARLARARGIPVLLDAERVKERTDELLPLCDIVISDETFASQYTGVADAEGALRALKQSCGAAIVGVTQGRHGSLVLADGDIVRTPGFHIAVVDTTGAGDVFHAAFGYGWLQGWPLERTCVFANAVAAMKCRVLGGRAGIPTLAEVEAFLSGAPGPPMAKNF